MRYVLPTQYNNFVKEITLIRKGEHRHFCGDRLYNSEAVCFSFGMKYPSLAIEYANKLSEDADRINLTRPSINTLIKELRKGANFIR